MFKLQNQIDHNKWRTVGRPYETAEKALAAAKGYDEDGFVHPALWRVVDENNKVVLRPKGINNV